MTSICFYFQVHQPFRIRRYDFDEIGINSFYEDHEKNVSILKKVAEKCYLPANEKMLQLINQHGGKFRVAYSISGTALEQFELYQPEVIDSFRKLAETGCVEFLGETYYHSLSYIYSPDEFHRQVLKHYFKIQELLGVTPSVFRNTELIFSNELARTVAAMGFRGMLCEGVDRLLNGQSPNHVFSSPGVENFGLLLKNYKLSDDIAFRFSNSHWEEFPLTADKYSTWVHDHASDSETINLFMDYETFGEHQWKETGIFEFLGHVPGEVLKHGDFDFKTPSEVIESYPARKIYEAPYFTSWADTERDLSAWMENKMQQHALSRIYSLENKVKQTKDKDLLNVWSKMQTSDHFYYMCTKYWSDGDVHKYFSPYDSPYDANIYYMNALSDLEITLERRQHAQKTFSKRKSTPVRRTHARPKTEKEIFNSQTLSQART
jgi:alpha-amylase